MQNFLTVAGIVLNCVDTTWGEDPPETLGEEVAMADNALGSTERSPRRVFSGDVVFATAADATAFLTAISVTGALGVPTDVTAESEADGATRGDTLTVSARLGRLVARRTYAAGVTSTTWRATLRLRETEA